jgi:hypothetical protein
MIGPPRRLVWLLGVGLLVAACPAVSGDEPPAIDPFGPRPQIRADAVPGCLELSDGTRRAGRLYLTRDARLKIFDAKAKSYREVPLTAIRRIDCKVEKEWLEKEWRFKESANDEKVYTGRSYPAREYLHTITLRDGRTIQGPLAAIVYLQDEAGGEPVRYLLHKRDKGPVGTSLASLCYVRSIRLGEDALKEGTPKSKK